MRKSYLTHTLFTYIYVYKRLATQVTSPRKCTGDLSQFSVSF